MMILNNNASRNKYSSLSLEELHKLMSTYNNASDLFDLFYNDITFNNRFFHSDDDFCRIIYTYLYDGSYYMQTKQAISKPSCFYRARIYKEKDKKKRYKRQFKKNYVIQQFEGYDKKGSGAPDPKLCKNDNRCSPKYISYLYCSNNNQTAIREITSREQEYISVAKIAPKKTLIIADFSHHIKVYEKTNENDWLKKFISQIEECFEYPVDKAETDKYIICQYVSEFVKSQGFDGLCYSSSKDYSTDAKNYVIFEPDTCDIVCSRMVKTYREGEEMWLKFMPKDCLNKKCGLC